jgi:hypothetical protein
VAPPRDRLAACGADGGVGGGGGLGRHGCQSMQALTSAEHTRRLGSDRARSSGLRSDADGR